MKAAEVVELVLSQVDAANSGVFAGAHFRDEPIVCTGAQLPSRVPQRIRDMRDLAKRAGWHSFAYGGARLFYEQARFMEDFEDDCPYRGQFERYFPTYEDMPDRVLRGYFTWRTRYRAGKAEEAPLSFLFLYAYELLCGVGTPAGEAGYLALGRFRASYAGVARSFDSHLRRWMADYAVYHGLDAASFDMRVPSGASASEFNGAVVLLRKVERALGATGNAAAWPDGGVAVPSGQREAAGVSSGEVVTADRLFEALSAVSRYRVGKSAAVREHREELAACCAGAFARLVDHCRRRRSLGFVDGAFGASRRRAYRMFANAVFFEVRPHPDAEYPLGEGDAFECRGGQWFRLAPCARGETSVELGNLLHAVDASLRVAVGDVAALKERADTPAFLRKMAESAVREVMERKAAEEAARVTIDRSALRGIRVAAAATCEALLVDEERDDPAMDGDGSDTFMAGQDGGLELRQLALFAGRDDGPTPATVDELVDVPAAGRLGPSGFLPGMSEAQRGLLESLLAGCFDAAAFAASGLSLAMEVDALNEALYDVLGDVAIEFDGDTPCVVEDYREDIVEALQ